MKTNGQLDADILEMDARRGEILLRKVCDFLARFVAYPSRHARIAHALWILHAHLMEKWDSTPRIAFLSPEPGSGKTRALEITELLVPRPVSAVNVSPAYLFRKVGSDDGRPTILFDEIDAVFGPKAKENEEIRGLLNAGHRRGAVAGRCVVRGKMIETEELPAYAAVALAGIGWLPDTILTRSVVVRMRRRRSDERVEAFRRRIHAPAGEVLRSQIETWAAGQLGDIQWPEMPAEITDRDADVWEPLLAVADLVGGEWPAMARAAAVALFAAAQDAEPSLGVRLLADLRTIFGAEEFLSTGAILVKLHAMEEAPWGDLHGKPIDSRGLAKRLRPYGIKPEVARIDNASTARGYQRASLDDQWLRYLPPLPARTETNETTETCAPSGIVRELPVTDVTHVTGDRGRELPDLDDDDPRWLSEIR